MEKQFALRIGSGKMKIHNSWKSFKKAIDAAIKKGQSVRRCDHPKKMRVGFEAIEGKYPKSTAYNHQLRWIDYIKASCPKIGE